MRHLLAACFCALALAVPSLAFAQSCPANAVQLVLSAIPPDHAIVSNYTAAAFETTAAGRSAGYDLVAGTVHMFHPGTISQLFVQGADRYRVTGVPEGTPIPLVVLYDVDGYAQSPGCGGAGCHGTFGAQVACGAVEVRRSVEATFSGRVDLVETLQLPLNVQAGEEFVVRFNLWFYRSSNGYVGEGTGRLRFGGLPPGAVVTSCQGYSSAPTSARTSTFGRIKTLYR